MTQAEAAAIAKAIKGTLPQRDRDDLKAIHVMPKLHNGMLTIRLHFYSRAADEPEAFIFADKEI